MNGSVGLILCWCVRSIGESVREIQMIGWCFDCDSLTSWKKWEMRMVTRSGRTRGENGCYSGTFLFERYQRRGCWWVPECRIRLVMQLEMMSSLQRVSNWNPSSQWRSGKLATTANSSICLFVLILSLKMKMTGRLNRRIFWRRRRAGSNELVDVHIDAAWTTNWKYFDFDTDMSSVALSRSMAREPWSREFFEILKE